VRAVVAAAAILVVSGKGAFAADPFTYTAEPAKEFGRTGAVVAGALKWECTKTRCTIAGPWPSMGVGDCQSLAQAVGPIKSFGRPGVILGAKELQTCNNRGIGLINPGAALQFMGRTTTPAASGESEGDADGDGHNSITAVGRWVWSEDRRENVLVGGPGDDCNDYDATSYPGNIEVCDAEGHDEDCDPLTFGFRDADSDGHPDAICLNVSSSFRSNGDDCDDTRGGIHPGVPEVCNGFDDDCDGDVDEAIAAGAGAMQVLVWEDRDRDGFGDPSRQVPGVCAMGDMRGLSINDYDCDDSRANRRPGSGCP
jgi:hypothetical protein